MPAQSHAAVQGDSPTPLPPAHQHAPTYSLQHLTGEVLATAHLLQQQVRTLECLAHATEEREATLAQQRAKLQELLRLVTQMETAEVRATASLRDTLARVRAGRARSVGLGTGGSAAALSFAALRLAGVGAGASPGGSLCPNNSPVAPPSPLGGSGAKRGGSGAGAGGGGGGGEGDADPVDNPAPGSASPKNDAEGCEAGGGEQRVGQSGEGEGTDGASKSNVDEGGSGMRGDGAAGDASQPLPQFASLRVQECKCVQGGSEEAHGAPPRGEGEDGVPLPLCIPGTDVAATPGASASLPMDQDPCGGDGRARADTEHGAERVDVLGSKGAQGAVDGEEGTDRRLTFDPRPAGAQDGEAGHQGVPTPSRHGNEPMRKTAAGSDGSWRARKRMPERNAKEQMKGVSAGTQSRQEVAKGKGHGQGEMDGQAGGQKKRGGQRTPSPKKAQVPGDRAQPSPPKKAGKAKGGVGCGN